MQFKKVITDDLLNLVLLLSLLKLNSIDISIDSFVDVPIHHQEVALGPSYGYHSSDYRNFYGRSAYQLERTITNKMLPMEFHQDSIFRELNELGSFSTHVNPYNRDIYAYLFDGANGNTQAEVLQGTSHQDDNNGTHSEDSDVVDSELSLEDADLIEILWKQDIDLGISKEVYDSQFRDKVSVNESEFENLKNQSKVPTSEEQIDDENLWNSLNYTIDTETGELIFHPEDDKKVDGSNESVKNQTNETRNNLDVPFLSENFTLHDALDFVSAENISSLVNGIGNSQNALGFAQNAIKEDEAEVSNIENHSTNEFTRLPLMHSIEERWQDVANLLDIPSNLTAPVLDHNSNMTSIQQNPIAVAPFQPINVSNLNPALIENATLPGPIQPLSPVMQPTDNTVIDQSNFMSTATNNNNGSEPNLDSTSMNFFENSYFPYSNNQTVHNVSNQAGGFLTGLISDEDLDFMGMVMNDAGEENITQNKVDVSNDSAVSSMSPEQFHALSDGEWFDSGSETSQTCQQGRYFGTNISSNEIYRLHSSMNSNVENVSTKYYGMNGNNRSAIAQKKYKFFGKKINQDSPCASGNEENNALEPFNTTSEHIRLYNDYHHGAVGPEVEGATAMAPNNHKFSNHNLSQPQTHYEMIPDYVYHNHTYGMSPEKEHDQEESHMRDKITRKHIDNDKGLTRDEKRAKELMIPLSIEEIVNLSMDEFNEKLSKFDFSETQLTLIRDIRRRGKNKVAAQNCRKRKLDQIFTLEDELKQLKDQKSSVEQERKNLLSKKDASYFNFLQLHDKILRSLMFHHQQQIGVGQPFSNPENFTLQLTPDGNVYLSPRNSTNCSSNFNNPSSSKHHDLK